MQDARETISEKTCKLDEVNLKLNSVTSSTNEDQTIIEQLSAAVQQSKTAHEELLFKYHCHLLP